MLHYRVVEKKRPGDEFTEGKYYGCLVNPGKIDLNGLAKRISAACTVTRADTLAVLSALQDEIIYALQSGMRVHLGDVGCFRLTCRGKGVEKKEDFRVSQIEKLKVVFHPNKILQEALAVSNKEISFYNVETAPAEAETTEPDEEQGV